MNHPKDTAPIAAFRNVETTVKTLAADSAISAERALNAAIVNADITRRFEEYLPSHRRPLRSGHSEAIVTMTEENHGRENVPANGD